MVKICSLRSKKLSEWSKGCAPRGLKTIAKKLIFVLLPPFTKGAVCPPRAPPECFYGIILGLRHDKSNEKFPPFTRGAVCPPRAPPECFYGIILGLRLVIACYFMLNYLNGILHKSPKLNDLDFNISLLSGVKNNPHFLTLRPYKTSSSTMLRPNSDISPTFCFSE